MKPKERKTKRIDADALGTLSRDAVVDERRLGWFPVPNAVIERYTPLMGYAALAVYVGLGKYTTARNRTGYPSIAKLAAMLRMGQSAVRASLKRLERAGLIQIKPRYRKNAAGEKIHSSNLYVLLNVPAPPHDAESDAETGDTRTRAKPRRNGRRSWAPKTPEIRGNPGAGGVAQGTPPYSEIGTTLLRNSIGEEEPFKKTQQQHAAPPETGTETGAAAAAKHQDERIAAGLAVLKQHGIDRTARARAVAARLFGNGHSRDEIAALIQDIDATILNARNRPVVLLSKLDDMTPAELDAAIRKQQDKTGPVSYFAE